MRKAVDNAAQSRIPRPSPALVRNPPGVVRQAPLASGGRQGGASGDGADAWARSG